MHAQEPISLHADDQRFWQQAYLQKLSFEKSNPKPFINNDLDAIQYIKVDFHQKLLVAFGAVVVNDVPASEAFNYSEYKQTKRIIFKESGGKPCIFHQPGTKINGQPKELMKILDKVKSLQD